MPSLVPALVSISPPPAVSVLLALGAVLAVVVVVILVRLYRPRRLDERLRSRGGVSADGSTAALGGAGAAHPAGGSDGCFDGCFDGGGGGGGSGGDC